MSAIFISYRRSGASQTAYRLKDKLKDTFGEQNVFVDLEDIDAGLPFADVIKNTLSQCSVILIVIGPKWLEMKDEAGNLRLDNAEDWVRQEIETAMASEARVIPVLVDGASELDAEQVPEWLREFAGLQAMRLSREETYWQFDVDRLIGKIEAADPELKKDEPKKKLKMSGKAITALVLSVLVLILVAQDAELDHDSVIGAIAFAVFALGLGIWGLMDVKLKRTAGHKTALVAILVAVLAGLASIGSLQGPGFDDATIEASEATADLNVQQDPPLDPNTLPPPAAAPSASAIADVSGTWLTSEGTRVDVTQVGDRFQYSEFDAAGQMVARGTGAVDGNYIESRFQAADNTYGEGEFEISADGQSITGIVTDAMSGDTYAVILKRP